MNGLRGWIRSIADAFIRRFPDASARLACHILQVEHEAGQLPEAAATRLEMLARAASAQGPDADRAADRQESYAQEGEDLIVARLVGDKTDGFYVDVGAHHPVRHSNTYRLYRRGWRGINIDATPGSMERFRRLRPRDINVECLVAATTEPRPFHVLAEPALNTASRPLAEQRRAENRHYRVTGTVTLQPRTLASILREHLPTAQAIDLMSVDVEGLDLEVLRSNDWQSYRPRILLVELLATALDEMESNEIVRFLRAQSYRPVAKLYNTVIFTVGSRP